jgi:hypothetical protein
MWGIGYFDGSKTALIALGTGTELLSMDKLIWSCA